MLPALTFASRFRRIALEKKLVPSTEQPTSTTIDRIDSGEAADKKRVSSSPRRTAVNVR